MLTTTGLTAQRLMMCLSTRLRLRLRLRQVLRLPRRLQLRRPALQVLHPVRQVLRRLLQAQHRAPVRRRPPLHNRGDKGIVWAACPPYRPC